MAEPSQYKQASRKGKKAWRKHVNLTDLDIDLEEARKEIIAGGIVRELPENELFVSDTTGSLSIQKTYNKKTRPLKADEILARRSAVDGLHPPKGKSHSTHEQASKLNNHISYKEYARLRNIAYGGQSVSKQVVEISEHAAYDPWDIPNLTTLGASEPCFLPPIHLAQTVIKIPVTLKAKPISLARSGRPVRSVRKPAAEKSYNPSAADWVARFDREGAREMAIELKHQDAKLLEVELLEKIKAAEGEDEEEWIDGSEWEGIESGTEDVPPDWLLKKRPDRKSKPQRNKIKKRKAEEALKTNEAREKLKRVQSQKIHALSREVNIKAMEREGQRKALALQQEEAQEAESSDDREDVSLRHKRPFGKAPLPQPELEVLLLEDLPDSLRKLKPEGNLLNDRYRSLLLQGKIESRKSVQSFQKQAKLTEKWSYKDWKLN